MGGRITWAGEVVTGTGKRLELGLVKKYFGTERGFPEIRDQGGGPGENAQ